MRNGRRARSGTVPPSVPPLSGRVGDGVRRAGTAAKRAAPRLRRAHTLYSPTTGGTHGAVTALSLRYEAGKSCRPHHSPLHQYGISALCALYHHIVIS